MPFFASKLLILIYLLTGCFLHVVCYYLNATPARGRALYSALEYEQLGTELMESSGDLVDTSWWNMVWVIFNELALPLPLPPVLRRHLTLSR